MTETAAKRGALLEDSTFNIITPIEKNVDFLFSSVEGYMRDAQKASEPEIVKMWNAITQDDQNH